VNDRLAAAALVGLTIVVAIGLRAVALGERADVGRPIAGVVALVDASAPLDDIFNGQFCGGTLVAPDRVMTAAHCVAGKDATRVEAVVGADNLCRGRPIDGVRLGVRKVETHPRYDAASAAFDLALLTIDHRFPDAIHPIGRADLSDGPAVALGWGRASLGGVPACRLIRNDLELLGDRRCTARIDLSGERAFDPSSMTCAIRADGSDACVGDSGGPLFIGPTLDEAVLVGVVSWGRGCGTGVPGVYAQADVWLSPGGVVDDGGA
jgi:trypsin